MSSGVYKHKIGRRWKLSDEIIRKKVEIRKKNGWFKNPKELSKKMSRVMTGNQYTKGKHWEWSEEAKRRAKGRPSNTNGKNWKVKDTSKMSEARRLYYIKNPEAKIFTEEHRKNIGEAQKGKQYIKKSLAKSGSKNPNWQDGKSSELYGFDWTELLRHSIRTRDCFVCQICRKNGWVVHHIDYNKKNNNPDNLITLCKSCHMKTNFNRIYWIRYFNDKKT